MACVRRVVEFSGMLLTMELLWLGNFWKSAVDTVNKFCCSIPNFYCLNFQNALYFNHYCTVVINEIVTIKSNGKMILELSEFLFHSCKINIHREVWEINSRPWQKRKEESSDAIPKSVLWQSTKIKKMAISRPIIEKKFVICSHFMDILYLICRGSHMKSVQEQRIFHVEVPC